MTSHPVAENQSRWECLHHRDRLTCDKPGLSPLTAKAFLKPPHTTAYHHQLETFTFPEFSQSSLFWSVYSFFPKRTQNAYVCISFILIIFLLGYPPLFFVQREDTYIFFPTIVNVGTRMPVLSLSST